MNVALRTRFDRLVDDVVASLPGSVRELLDEAPIIVEDAPDPSLLNELGLGDHGADELCGLHTGVPITERSIETTELEYIHVFRRGVIVAAGGSGVDDARLREEIRVTILHEIGHHFGLDEDDLDELGYA